MKRLIVFAAALTLAGCASDRVSLVHHPKAVVHAASAPAAVPLPAPAPTAPSVVAAPAAPPAIAAPAPAAPAVPATKPGLRERFHKFRARHPVKWLHH